MAPSTKPHALPAYSCGSHWHFEPHKDGSGWFSSPVKTPWYMRKDFPERGKYQLGQRGIYVRNSSSSGTFRIKYLLESGFYSLTNEQGEVQWCMGKHGRLEDKLWREEDLSTQSWGQAASSRPPPYSSAGSAAYATGYEKK